MKLFGKSIRRRWVLVVLGIVALASCRAVSFYTQAARGQIEISMRARPITEVVADASTSAGVKEKLLLVEELRAFAKRELHLPADKQYDRYCDLGRKHVVWVVYAAPEFSVEGVTWWYPLVGSLKYRGYFKEEDAKAEADRLRAKGLDVFVGGVDGYSTLGWFRDPVLNTFLRRSDAELAELIFHELTHQRLYISGGTDFNEAFATAVGQEGARRWLRSAGRVKELETYESELRLQRDFISVVLETRKRLKQIYAEHEHETPEHLRALKQAEFDHMRADAEEMKKRWGGRLAVDRWFKQPPNNARLNTLATYYDLVPGFESLLRDCGGDMERFLDRVDSMRSMSKAERKKRMSAPRS